MELPGFPDEPHQHDHGDDYGMVLLEYLNGLVIHGWIDAWEAQPDNGYSIVLHRKEWGGGFVMSYCDALEYARGLSDAGHLLTSYARDTCTMCRTHTPPPVKD